MFAHCYWQFIFQDLEHGAVNKPLQGAKYITCPHSPRTTGNIKDVRGVGPGRFLGKTHLVSNISNGAIPPSTSGISFAREIIKYSMPE